MLGESSPPRRTPTTPMHKPQTTPHPDQPVLLQQAHLLKVNDLYDKLRERLPRLTKGKKLVAECLLANAEPMTAHEIYARIADTTNATDSTSTTSAASTTSILVDLATVYRNLEQLERVGVVEKIEHSSGGWKYVLAGAHHGHSIRCVRCEQEVVMNDCMLAEVERVIAQRTGFQTVRHTVNFTGTCPACQ
jgi:Fe2+ or Zn2+ uptake regulation protein